MTYRLFVDQKLVAEVGSFRLAVTRARSISRYRNDGDCHVNVYDADYQLAEMYYDGHSALGTTAQKSQEVTQ